MEDNKNLDIAQEEALQETQVENIADVEEEHQWYILQTRAAYENKVKNALLVKKDTIPSLQNYLIDVVVKTEEKIKETPTGKRKTVVINKFPTYVFIKMKYSDEVWRIVINTDGVTSFVGPKGRPRPLTIQEVRRNQLEEVEQDFNIQVGDTVRIIAGSFDNKEGVVTAIDAEREKITVVLTMFGRDMKVDFDANQIDKI